MAQLLDWARAFPVRCSDAVAGMAHVTASRVTEPVGRTTRQRRCATVPAGHRLAAAASLTLPRVRARGSNRAAQRGKPRLRPRGGHHRGHSHVASFTVATSVPRPRGNGHGLRRGLRPSLITLLRTVLPRALTRGAPAGISGPLDTRRVRSGDGIGGTIPDCRAGPFATPSTEGDGPRSEVCGAIRHAPPKNAPEAVTRRSDGDCGGGAFVHEATSRVGTLTAGRRLQARFSGVRSDFDPGAVTLGTPSRRYVAMKTL